ncbi:MAG: 30S ribosomal protein S19 [Planctomycetota bacterium]|jgi:small subunit ribosomal protein S19|nr:30S ribosomal protein S19 [Planctomycetota bacterium]|tara:strand:+ start:95 stop:379 length:285 start_codon:yes stop_codon:yes gene_type:complete
MGRSIKKGPFIDPSVARKVAAMEASGTKSPITTWARASTILPEYVNLVFMVHDGRKHIKVTITEDMVGHRLGEFAVTRTFRGHTNKKEGLRVGN